MTDIPLNEPRSDSVAVGAEWKPSHEYQPPDERQCETGHVVQYEHDYLPLTVEQIAQRWHDERPDLFPTYQEALSFANREYWRSR